jgi:hypothetical protein
MTNPQPRHDSIAPPSDNQQDASATAQSNARERLSSEAWTPQGLPGGSMVTDPFGRARKIGEYNKKAIDDVLHAKGNWQEYALVGGEALAIGLLTDGIGLTSIGMESAAAGTGIAEGTGFAALAETTVHGLASSAVTLATGGLAFRQYLKSGASSFRTDSHGGPRLNLRPDRLAMFAVADRPVKINH